MRLDLARPLLDVVFQPVRVEVRLPDRQPLSDQAQRDSIAGKQAHTFEQPAVWGIQVTGGQQTDHGSRNALTGHLNTFSLFRGYGRARVLRAFRGLAPLALLLAWGIVGEANDEGGSPAPWSDWGERGTLGLEPNASSSGWGELSGPDRGACSNSSRDCWGYGAAGDATRGSSSA